MRSNIRSRRRGGSGGGLGGGFAVCRAAQRLRHVEFVRREPILAITHEYAVNPYVDRGCRAMERQAHRAPVPQCAHERRIQREPVAVDRHMVVFGDVRRLRILMAVPWVLDVDVLVPEVSGHLQMARHFDRAEIAILEIGGGERRVRHVHVVRLLDAHLPFAVKALLRLRRFADNVTVVRMRRPPIHCEHRRIGEPVRARFGCVEYRVFDCIRHVRSPYVTTLFTASLRLRHICRAAVVIKFTNNR